VVYMAEQADPIRRKVALKIIKLGMDTKQVIARFEAERQALAMMDHPNIAKVLDAGATETGRPYFVMELVTGVSITEYCDKNELNMRERLALFIEVCNAVQHAHQKGIIHRDIKPSNVMVTHRDGTPVPKIIDFGIAKAINQRLTEKTLFTRYAHIIGTPAYMSPEQAELSDLDIDTRSDIYSLGVLLYELLTGTPPFSEEELRKAGYLEMQRIIREEEPTKPSTKLSTLGETLSETAKHRSSTPDLLRKAVRGDLDWIVMKTLKKARDRRYDTVSALALDVQRHLHDQPILARAPGTIYVLRKFLRRHRGPTIAVLATASLLTTTIVMLSLWSRDRIRLEEAEAFAHRSTYTQARMLAINEDFVGAVQCIEPVVNSKHVGAEARGLHHGLLVRVQEQIDHYTRKINSDPEDPNNYLSRARYSHCLHDKEQVLADMNKYVSILSPLQGTNSHDRWFQDLLIGLWRSDATNLGPTINTIYHDGMGGTGCMSADGLSLYFGSDRPGGLGASDIWITMRRSLSDPWETPANLGSPVNTGSGENVPTITADGLSLFFHSTRAPGYGERDIWVSTRKRTGDTWGEPKNLGPLVNSESSEWSQSISSDGLSLYFGSGRPGGQGSFDVWVTTRATKEDPWGTPVNLGPKVNSSSNDALPNISADGLILFFVSERPGGYGGRDLWVTRRATTSDPWEQAVNLGPPFNTSEWDHLPIISPDGSTVYFSSTRPGGHGGEDLWRVPILPQARDLRQCDDPGVGTEADTCENREEVIR